MKSQQDYEIDIKNNKVKEGFLIKRSRILKEWKQRWMVLTRTHLYSFAQKQIYKKPTEIIPLREVSTIKSYYKNQYSRPQVIRIESDDTEFYLSAKNHQEKWAWMTAIQKMTDLTVNPQQQSSDSQNLIRETIRMSTAIRNTINMNVEKKQINNDIPKDFMKKLKICLDSNTVSSVVCPTYNKQTDPNMESKAKQLKPLQEEVKSQEEQKQKIVEKIVYVPQIKEKIVYVTEVKEKIVYVPEVKEVIKTVYVQKEICNNSEQKSLMQKGSDSGGEIMELFRHVMEMKCQNPRPLIQFLVFLMFSEPQRYTELVLSFATSIEVQHAFSNAFLQILNDEIDEQKLNSYLQFIMVLYENREDYFYMNDLKLLIQILIREIEMNRSYLNQFLIIGVINVMADKKWWQGIKHRRQQLASVVNDVKSWTTDPQTRLAAQQLIHKL